MVWFKACPRCETGDLSLENDIYGWHAMCMACGYVRDIDVPSRSAVRMKRRQADRMQFAQPA